ncbi:tRNA-splicing endonuclease subunit Sen2 [Sinocyclocheilus rhinocerous]|uniref:tRNA-splicing endonuclease subunit Sen2 n=1 Tax=Sinocyclocheilus rhinocerous TaxID=307959 RepID=UPI0007B946FF|nr:PREDICTED: tRNA-splicing endonuclease subunit Sen2 [Sinocyclocheilus rhinocerous]
MTEAVFQAPKRRAKVYESFEAPLPISLGAENIIYRAEIISHHVVVTDPAHILPLYERGYFGKGVFSRSRPEHGISQQWKYVGDRCLPVISSSEYQKRLRWARAALLMQGLEDESVSHALETLTKPVEFVVGEEQSLGSLVDQSMDEVSCEHGSLDRTDPARPQRQGNPLYDPLAEVCPEEPEQLLKAHVKCRRPDRPEEQQPMSSEAYQHVLVALSEDDDSASSATANVSGEQQGKLVCRINPFSMMEYLQLSYEEAFFLVYALGCLSVYYSGEALSVAQVWTMFRSLQPNFSSSYAAYHYFRSKGWVPKSGVKYGTDLMLYRKGPPFYHARFVLNQADVENSLRPFSWKSLAALSRTTGNVSKELMLCSVITPSDMTEDMLSSPECLKRFTLQEVMVSRWVSSRERTEQEEI